MREDDWELLKSCGRLQAIISDYRKGRYVMKYKVGDKVKVVTPMILDDYKLADNTFTISEVCPRTDGYEIDVPGERSRFMRESQLELVKSVREKTLSEASYEELAKEMWKRCAENTSLV